MFGESVAVQWLSGLSTAHASVVLVGHACDAMSDFVLQDGQGRTGNASVSQPTATTVDKRSGVISVGDTMEPEVRFSKLPASLLSPHLYLSVHLF